MSKVGPDRAKVLRRLLNALQAEGVGTSDRMFLEDLYRRVTAQGMHAFLWAEERERLVDIEIKLAEARS
jgi:hypothetical protein